MCFTTVQSVLIEGGFDEAACRSYYAARLGAPSRRGAISACTWWAKGIDSERGLEWRWDSLCYGSFYGWKAGIVWRTIPGSRTRARLPHEVHTAIFDWVLAD